MCGVALAFMLSPLPLMAQGGAATTSGSATSGSSTTTTSGSGSTSTTTSTTFAPGLTVSGPTQSAVGSAGSATTIPSSSNIISQTYVNPLSLGLPANYSSKFGPQNVISSTGGPKGKYTFLYVATPSAATSATTATSNAGTGFNSYGIPRSPLYSTVLADDIPIPKHESAAVQADLKSMIARSSFLKNKAAIQVQMDGSVAILSGVVGNEKERRIAEGLVRTTPGVLDVRNELQVMQKLP